LRELADQRELEYERDRLLEQLEQEKEDLAALSQFTTNAISTLNLIDGKARCCAYVDGDKEKFL
jgi:hypothetical protein